MEEELKKAPENLCGIASKQRKQVSHQVTFNLPNQHGSTRKLLDWKAPKHHLNPMYNHCFQRHWAQSLGWELLIYLLMGESPSAGLSKVL